MHLLITMSFYCSSLLLLTTIYNEVVLRAALVGLGILGRRFLIDDDEVCMA